MNRCVSKFVIWIHDDWIVFYVEWMEDFATFDSGDGGKTLDNNERYPDLGELGNTLDEILRWLSQNLE